jgi:hypothetical protein
VPGDPSSCPKLFLLFDVPSVSFSFVRIYFSALDSDEAHLVSSRAISTRFGRERSSRSEQSSSLPCLPSPSLLLHHNNNTAQILPRLHRPTSLTTWNGTPLSPDLLPDFFSKLPASRHEVQSIDVHPVLGTSMFLSLYSLLVFSRRMIATDTFLCSSLRFPSPSSRSPSSYCFRACPPLHPPPAYILRLPRVHRSLSKDPSPGSKRVQEK